MENNTIDIGGRVTRSLRKRLTSVDSDNSRPGTPISTKLISISEISASPARSTRMSRRNSSSGIATPVKTPAKRGIGTPAIVENIETNTSAKRSTRSCCVLIYENETISQLTKKNSKFSALEEEIAPNDPKTTGVTCTQTQSPQQIKNTEASPIPKKTRTPDDKDHNDVKIEAIQTITPKRRKPGPKCKTREHDEDMSDIEVIILENNIEDFKNKSMVMVDDKSKQMACSNVNENNQVENNNEKTTGQINDIQQSHPASEELTTNMSELQLKKESTETASLCSTDQSNVLQNALINNSNIIEEPIDDENRHQNKSDEELTTSSQSKDFDHIEKQNINISNESQESIINEPDGKHIEKELKCELDTMQRNKINLSITETVEFNIDTIDINVKNCSKEELRHDNILTPCRGDDADPNINNSNKASSKKVDFVLSPSNDINIKNVYPKTPASTKTSISFRETNLSSEEDLNALRRSEHNTNETGKEAKKQIIEKDMTPCVLNCSNALEIVENQTPSSTASSEREDPLPILEKNTIKIEENSEKPLNVLEKSLHEEIVASDNQEEQFRNQNKEFNWVNPCVKGKTTDGSKLDVVLTQNNIIATDYSNKTDCIVKEIPTNGKKSIIFSSEDERDCEDDYNELTEEESYVQKHDFLDDEAVEVNDYQSGDSMNSEERREIEENEIPIDVESIGSHTTEDERDECEEENSENVDSFIVSDSEAFQFSESDNAEENIDEYINEKNSKKNKKSFKRLLRPAQSSTSSDEEAEVDHNSDSCNVIKDNRKALEKLDTHNEHSIFQSEKQSMSNENEDIIDTKALGIRSKSNSSPITVTNTLLSNSNDNKFLDSSKLSDSALRLHCTVESESEESIAENINMARKEILCNLNQSDRFNKSVRDLNPEIDECTIEDIKNQYIAKQNPEIIPDNNNEKKPIDEWHATATTPDEGVNKTRKINNIQSESLLGDVSVRSESDAEKENEHDNNTHHRKTDNGLSVSFRNKKPKGTKERQRSFTVDVTIKGDALETTVVDSKLEELVQTSSSDDLHNEEVKSKELKYQENIRQFPLPLGNPLIRTRRQSLALPRNPDMEICSSSHVGGIGKKTRKSLGALLNNDFNPSQSFIDFIDLQKKEQKQLVPKRKRLSKSFCGASETHNNSVIDIDVRHTNKRSKLMFENSRDESHLNSIEDINTSKLSTKISSTPHEKNNKNNNSYNKNQRIIRRCEEILEAANRAKLEAKINNRKNKAKIPKKQLKKKSVLTPPDETNRDEPLRRVSKEIKRKEKNKIISSQAIKAADVILRKKIKPNPNMNEEEDKLEKMRLTPNALEAIRECVPIKNKCKQEVQKKEKMIINVPVSTTAAGKLMELPQSPEKKKKPQTFIKLSTGKVSVEPITPKKRLVQASNGVAFRESPITPYSIGFKVQQIAPSERKISPPSALIERKRKRYDDKLFKVGTLSKSHWTQSGLFVEEEIQRNRQSGDQKLWGRSQKAKKNLLESDGDHNVNRNFKEIAMMRPDISRSTKRELLLLKKRRQVGGQY